MKLVEILWQHRYDYKGRMECEHCGGFALDESGYNDGNYHDRVIPAMLCPHCGKNRDGLTEKTRNGVTGNILTPEEPAR